MEEQVAEWRENLQAAELAEEGKSPLQKALEFVGGDEELLQWVQVTPQPSHPAWVWSASPPPSCQKKQRSTLSTFAKDATTEGAWEVPPLSSIDQGCQTRYLMSPPYIGGVQSTRVAKTEQTGAQGAHGVT